MFEDLMGKMQEMQQKVEETKKRLDTVSVQGEAEGGLVKVTATANRKITEINIDDSLMQEGDKEQIEDLVIVAVNRALEEAEKVNEAEMQSAAKGFLPNMPGLF